MKKHRWSLRTGSAVAGLAAALFLTAGCEETGDNKDYDYDPPSGRGVLVVDNQTIEDMDVYVDGHHRIQVDRNDDEGLDLVPGRYRIVLVEEHGAREWSGDVDILEGRQTIVRAVFGSDREEYDVSVRFD